MYPEHIKVDFSLHVHELAAPHVFKKLTVFERKMLAHSMRFTGKGLWSRIGAVHLVSVRDMWIKYCTPDQQNGATK